MRPLFKHPGGKTQIIQALLEVVPARFSGYYEPMLGGGALFWALAEGGHLNDREVVLGDTDCDLIATYKAVKEDPAGLIDELSAYAKSYSFAKGAEMYYRVRAEWNEGKRSPARLIFLKQTSFNGLWRYNKGGLLNMAWGKYVHPKILDTAHILHCAQLLNELKVQFIADDYRAVVERAHDGDFVYFDPPYQGCFDGYGPAGFSDEKHQALIKDCMRLTARGVQVLYSNEGNRTVYGWLDKVWKRARVTEVGARRYINRDGAGREPVRDLLVSGPWDGERLPYVPQEQLPLTI